ncbi:MAG TPA: LLM class flavin-dependent oxidoreductase [Pseudonocardiaceae bacterium]|jgi:alkanesulfonate monooxygenase SsuD/methylene tetrahydromethanopterin reductase-like flavin-dependent oxidoreductase (luciferase family)
MTEPTRLSFGIKTTPQNVSFADILRVWAEADTIPVIEHAWLWDHLQPMRGDTSIPVLEGWTALAALAEGRLVLGIGAGGSAGPESEAYGIAAPGAGERIARLAESITIIKRMFTEDTVDFDGRYHRLTAARCDGRQRANRSRYTDHTRRS